MVYKHFINFYNFYICYRWISVPNFDSGICCRQIFVFHFDCNHTCRFNILTIEEQTLKSFTCFFPHKKNITRLLLTCISLTFYLCNSSIFYGYFYSEMIVILCHCLWHKAHLFVILCHSDDSMIMSTFRIKDCCNVWTFPI